MTLGSWPDPQYVYGWSEMSFRSFNHFSSMCKVCTPFTSRLCSNRIVVFTETDFYCLLDC